MSRIKWIISDISRLQRIWNDGLDARRNGLNDTVCPFKNKCKEKDAWLNGYNDIPLNNAGNKLLLFWFLCVVPLFYPFQFIWLNDKISVIKRRMFVFGFLTASLVIAILLAFLNK